MSDIIIFPELPNLISEYTSTSLLFRLRSTCDTLETEKDYIKKPQCFISVYYCSIAS